MVIIWRLYTIERARHKKHILSENQVLCKLEQLREEI